MTTRLITGIVALMLLLGAVSQSAFATLADMAEIQDWQGLRTSISSEDVNAAQPDGMNALLWAVYHDETSVVRLLLDAGAEPNVENRYGLSPLYQASFNGNAEVVSLLLDAGAEADKRTLQGDTPLMNAARSGNVAAVQALIESGADVNARDLYLFETPLMWAAGENHTEVVRVLAENGADVNAKSAELEFAGNRGGGLRGTFPSGGLTALHIAAREDAIETVELLLTLGADPNMLDPQGISPLRIAATNANLDVAKLLIESGADIADGSFIDIMEVQTFPQIRAAKNYQDQTTVLELLALMLDMGGNVDSTAESAIPMPGSNFTGGGGTSGMQPLYAATAMHDFEMMNFLIGRGADVNMLSNGNTPLMAALEISQRGNEGSNGNGGTLEGFYSQDLKLEHANFLIANGADVNTRTGTGGTALHVAAGQGNNEMVTFLIEQGIDLSVKDDSNRSALDVANGIPAVGGGGGGRGRGEGQVHEDTVALLREAMQSAGVAIEDYVAPPTPEAGDEA